MARRVKHRRSARTFGARTGGMNKWFKIAAFATGAAIIAPKVMPSISPQIAGAAGGFFAGGAIGAVAGYLAAPALKNVITGSTGGTSSSAYL